MAILNEEQLVSIEFDLEEMKKNKGRLDESWLAMFGSTIKIILQDMFGGPKAPVGIRGSRSDVNAFARTLGREKNYLESVARNGLDDPRTFKNKSKLEMAIKNFEGETGLIWPFK